MKHLITILILFASLYSSGQLIKQRQIEPIDTLNLIDDSWEAYINRITGGGLWTDATPEIYTNNDRDIRLGNGTSIDRSLIFQDGTSSDVNADFKFFLDESAHTFALRKKTTGVWVDIWRVNDANDGKFSLRTGTRVDEISTDGTLAGNADDVIVTEKAIKTYVDAQVGGITGSGVSGRVTYWNGTSTVTSSAGFTFNGTNVTSTGIIKGAVLTSTGEINGTGLNLTDADPGIVFVTSGGDTYEMEAHSTGWFFQNASTGTTFFDMNASDNIRTFSNWGFGIAPTTTSTLSVDFDTAPSGSSDTGTIGEVRFTTTYIYVCTATDTWKRTALTTW